MKKIIASLLIAFATVFSAKADTVTNYVYVISNVFVHTYHENTITQKVRNAYYYDYYYTNNFYNITYETQIITQRVIGTHYNYYYTNYLQDIVYETRYITQTNVAYTEMFDVSQQAIEQARQYANNSASSANSSQGAAQTSQSHMWSAQRASGDAATSAGTAASILGDITQKQGWFDEHFGQLITNINFNYSSIITNFMHTNNGETVLDHNIYVSWPHSGLVAYGGQNVYFLYNNESYGNCYVYVRDKFDTVGVDGNFVIYFACTDNRIYERSGTTTLYFNDMYLSNGVYYIETTRGNESATYSFNSYFPLPNQTINIGRPSSQQLYLYIKPQTYTSDYQIVKSYLKSAVEIEDAKSIAIAASNLAANAISKKDVSSIVPNINQFYNVYENGTATNSYFPVVCQTKPLTFRVKISYYQDGTKMCEKFVYITNRGSYDSGKWFNYQYTQDSGNPQIYDIYWTVSSRVLVIDCTDSTGTRRYNCHCYSDNAPSPTSQEYVANKTLTRLHPFPYIGTSMVIYRGTTSLTQHEFRFEMYVDSVTENSSGSSIDDYVINADFSYSCIDDNYVFDRMATKSDIIGLLKLIMYEVSK